ncbi:MAG: DUF192 domain-containing protein, partial [Abditibacteriaceae bacterium]
KQGSLSHYMRNRNNERREITKVLLQMKTVSLHNKTQDRIICQNCGVANNPLTRMKGLLGRETLADDEGLLIVPCSSIHMWGMKFALDVIFLTRENVVTDFAENISPGKIYAAKRHHGKAHAALEVAAGTAARNGLQWGDQLEVREIPPCRRS